MGIGSFEVTFIQSIQQHYHELCRRLIREGHTKEEILSEFEQIALRHSVGSCPEGFVRLTDTPDKNYPSFGGRIFGTRITYHVRQTGKLVVVEFIEL
jgi:hypothetical protein